MIEVTDSLRPDVSNNSQKRPIVSVVVVTYNSSKTIIETLESIREQTYESIELVISDDCSSDETIAMVNKWIELNSARFVHTKVVTTDKNTGVAGNLNRGITKAQGSWIKSIAGDDLLVPEAIEEYVKFVNNNDIVQMCVCDVECFTTMGAVPTITEELYKRYFEYSKEPYELQRKRVMTKLVFVGPTYFYSRKLYDEIGGFTDKYGCAEEWPFVYKILRSGHRIYSINKKLVRYRVQAVSVSHNKESNGLINKRLFMGIYQHYFDHPFKDLVREGHILTAWHYALYYWSKKCQYSIKNKTISNIVGCCFTCLSPLTYLEKLHLVKV